MAPAENYQLFSDMYSDGSTAAPHLAAMKSKKRVLIVGGGLSGLTLAYRLHEKNIDITILEAASRLGGRIMTVAGASGTPLELGATWFSGMHTHLISLLEEVGLEKYPQFSEGISLFQTKSFEPAQQFYVPAGETPSYRIAGGTQALINVLAARLSSPATRPNEQPNTSKPSEPNTIRPNEPNTSKPSEPNMSKPNEPNTIRLNTRVRAVRAKSSVLTVETISGEVFTADIVALCLPPQLAVTTIDFEPALPETLRRTMPGVQTWMAGAIKFVLEYANPFWREKGYSGMLYSHAGIITEMYDHTNREGDRFGFTGFLVGGAAGYTREVRQELVLRQLTVLLGEAASRPASYLDKVWNDDLLVTGEPVILRPHQNQGHPALQMPYMEGKLFLCGTEVSAEHPGYMEGAVSIAKSVASLC